MSSHITMEDKDKLAKAFYGYESYTVASQPNREYIDSISTYGELSGDLEGSLFIFKEPSIYNGDPIQYISIPSSCPSSSISSFRKTVLNNIRESDILFIAYQLQDTDEWEILDHADDNEYSITLSSPLEYGDSVFSPKIVHEDQFDLTSGILIGDFNNPVDKKNIIAAAIDSLEKYEKRLHAYIKKYRSAS